MACKLQTKVLAFLNGLPHCWAIKVISANERGCPDILCCHNGQFWAFEIKEGNDRVSKIQQAQLDRINQASGRYAVIRSIDRCAEIVGKHHPKAPRI